MIFLGKSLTELKENKFLSLQFSLDVYCLKFSIIHFRVIAPSFCSATLRCHANAEQATCDAQLRIFTALKKQKEIVHSWATDLNET